MQVFFIIAILVLAFVIIFQISKASEYVAVLRGWERTRKQTNRINAFMLLAFLVLGLIGVYICNEQFKGRILGEPASDHGVLVDRMLYVTIAINAPAISSPGMTPARNKPPIDTSALTP
jgi:cytochrome c oxidase subunit 2